MGCEALINAPKINTKSAIKLYGMFYGCTSLKTVEFCGGIKQNCNCGDIFTNVPAGGTIYLDFKNNRWNELLAQIPKSWKIIYRN